jgi:dihydrofolate synthase/folylpolyglutamate synthase
VTEHPVLSALARFGIRMGIGRMQDFLSTVGDPHRRYPVIHVAGTNGKGSTVRILGSVLRAAGYRVGEYTSPHLQRINERVQVDGIPITDEELERLLSSTDEARHQWVAELDDDVPADRVLTYFEMITAVAFQHFAASEVDVAIVEVGLGGRLDATNVVDPLITVITSIGLDHTRQLGNDCASIAAEKAGIIKTGVPLVLGVVGADAARVIRTIAHERGAQLVRAEDDFRVLQHRDGTFGWSYCGRTEHGLRVGMSGDHQMANAGVALTLLAMIGDRFPIPDWNDVVRGLAEARHPGRLEQAKAGLLIDCAHNVMGASSLAEYLRALPRTGRRTLLLGTSTDKDPREMMGPLASQVDRVWTTHCAHPRAMPAGDLAQKLVDVRVPVLPAGPIEDALAMAMEQRESDADLVVVAGSVFLAGAVRDLVNLP